MAEENRRQTVEDILSTDDTAVLEREKKIIGAILKDLNNGSSQIYDMAKTMLIPELFKSGDCAKVFKELIRLQEVDSDISESELIKLNLAEQEFLTDCKNLALTTDGKIEIDYLFNQKENNLKIHIKRKKNYEDFKKPDSLIGYDLDGFSRITEQLDGLRSGLYLIGGHTHKGKTALLVNLFLGLINSSKNEGVKALFISLDDNKDIIVNRLVAVMGNTPWRYVQKPQAYQSPLHESGREKGYSRLIQLIDEGRIDIRDISDIWEMEQLDNLVDGYKGQRLVVFLDALYHLGVSGTVAKDGIRGENIARAVGLKRLVDTYNIPIIATVELRKLGQGENTDKKPTYHDIAEAREYSYRSTLIWLVHSIEKDFRESDAPEITLICDKDKVSGAVGEMPLVLNKATGRVTEMEYDEGHYEY